MSKKKNIKYLGLLIVLALVIIVFIYINRTVTLEEILGSEDLHALTLWDGKEFIDISSNQEEHILTYLDECQFRRQWLTDRFAVPSGTRVYRVQIYDENPSGAWGEILLTADGKTSFCLYTKETANAFYEGIISEEVSLKLLGVLQEIAQN